MADGDANQPTSFRAIPPEMIGEPNGPASLDGSAKQLVSEQPDRVLTTNGERPVGKGEQVLDPRDFGAKGDGRYLPAVILTTDANTVYADGQFTESDIGRRVVVLPKPGQDFPSWSATITGLVGGTTDGKRNGVTTDTAWTRTAASAGAAYVASDDTAALQAWLDSPSTLKRTMPGLIFGFTAGLVLRGWYDLEASQGGKIAAMAELPVPTDWPFAARTVPTALTTPHRVLNVPNQTVTGLTIECNLLCDDGFAAQWVRNLNLVRVKVSGHRRRGVTAGEQMVGSGDLSIDAQRSSSYEAKITDCQTWREYGVVPRPAFSSTWADPHTVMKGTPALSVGFYIGFRCTDSAILGKTVAMGDQVGFQLHAGNTLISGAHAWARSEIGQMDVAFNIISDNVICQSTYADTAYFAGYWHHGTLGEFYNAKVFNNSGGSIDHALGWVLTNPDAPGHVWSNCHVRGSAGRPLRGDIGNTSGAYVEVPGTGRFNLGAGHVIEQFVNLFHLATDATRRPQQKATDYTLTLADHGSVLEMNSGTPVTVTFPSTLPVGYEVGVLQVGDGQVTIAGGTGVGIEMPAGRVAITRGKRSEVKVRRRQGGVTAVVSGDLLLAHYFIGASTTVNRTQNGGTIEYDSVDAGTITFDANSLPADGFVNILQKNIGQVTLAVTDGKALVSPDGKLKTRVRYSSVQVRRMSATGDYVASGDLTA